MSKKQKYDKFETRQQWFDFLESKGFRTDEEMSYAEDASFVFFGCNPEIRVELMSGEYREDTETGGCITADFKEAFNKTSQCPVYFCDNVSHEKFWSAIELLMDAGIEFSQYCGRIEEGNGCLFCDPPVEKHNKEKIYRRMK